MIRVSFAPLPGKPEVVQGIAELDVNLLLRQEPPHVVLAPDRAGTVLGHGVEEQPREVKRRRRKLVPRPGQTARSCRFKKLRALAKDCANASPNASRLDNDN